MLASELFDYCHRGATLSWCAGDRATDIDIPLADGESLLPVPFNPWRSALVALLDAPDLKRLEPPHWLSGLQGRARVLIVVAGIAPPRWLSQAAARAGVALWQTPMSLLPLQACLVPLLQRAVAPRCQLHASLLRVAGVGVLLLGGPGAGKSSLALALLGRGHGLVADDVVGLARDSDGGLLGSNPCSLSGYLFVRGLGLVDVVAEFGAMALAYDCRVDLLVLLAADGDAATAAAGRAGIAAHAELSGERFRRSWLGVSLEGLVLRGNVGAADRVEAYTRRYLLARSGRSVVDEFGVSLSESINKSGVRE